MTAVTSSRFGVLRWLLLAIALFALLFSELVLAETSRSLRIEGTSDIRKQQVLDESTDGHLREKSEERKADDELRTRVRSLRDKTAILIEDARQLSDKTKELSQRADRMIKDVPSMMTSRTSSTSKLRGSCSSHECGVRCVKDCRAQCSIAKLLGLDEAENCNTRLCAKLCATGCTKDACTFQFVYT